MELIGILALLTFGALIARAVSRALGAGRPSPSEAVAPQPSPPEASFQTPAAAPERAATSANESTVQDFVAQALPELTAYLEDFAELLPGERESAGEATDARQLAEELKGVLALDYQDDATGRYRERLRRHLTRKYFQRSGLAASVGTLLNHAEWATFLEREVVALGSGADAVLHNAVSIARKNGVAAQSFSHAGSAYRWEVHSSFGYDQEVYFLRLFQDDRGVLEVGLDKLDVHDVLSWRAKEAPSVLVPGPWEAVILAAADATNSLERNAFERWNAESRLREARRARGFND